MISKQGKWDFVHIMLYKHNNVWQTRLERYYNKFRKICSFPPPYASRNTSKSIQVRMTASHDDNFQCHWVLTIKWHVFIEIFEHPSSTETIPLRDSIYSFLQCINSITVIYSFPQHIKKNIINSVTILKKTEVLWWKMLKMYYYFPSKEIELKRSYKCYVFHRCP